MKRSAWIEPDGTLHRLHYGGHASVVRKAGLYSGDVNSEANEAAQSKGWIFIEWLSDESVHICAVVSLTDHIPDRQMDAWLEWCEEFQVKPSSLRVVVVSEMMGWQRALNNRLRIA